jgi:uncharacterized protein YdaU (DUF1376 family)
MSDELFGDRRKALEEEFFRRHDTALIARRRTEEERRAARAALAAASHITDDALLDHNARSSSRCASLTGALKPSRSSTHTRFPTKVRSAEPALRSRRSGDTAWM